MQPQPTRPWPLIYIAKQIKIKPRNIFSTQEILPSKIDRRTASGLLTQQKSSLLGLNRIAMLIAKLFFDVAQRTSQLMQSCAVFIFTVEEKANLNDELKCYLQKYSLVKPTVMNFMDMRWHPLLLVGQG